MSKKGKNKKKKEKVRYIDDGRTIADMSGVGGMRYGGGYKPRASLREQKNTFFAAQRKMFLPMLAVIGLLTAIFLIAYILLSIAPA